MIFFLSGKLAEYTDRDTGHEIHVALTLPFLSNAVRLPGRDRILTQNI